MGVAKRKWAGLQFSAPPPTLAYTNEIWYEYRVRQDTQKSILDQLPASNRKSAILTTRCHFERFQVSIICILFLNYLLDKLLLVSASSKHLWDQFLLRKSSIFPTLLPWRRQGERHSERHHAIKHKILITPTYIIQTSWNFIHTSGSVKYFKICIFGSGRGQTEVGGA